ncbi:GNAT family N-acetyltransferase [Nocardia neocaledoniensis]|uniref:GNAT family N-acetyltransferase n=1 Tax=Nocardia neocaledoniensis TaxID=236511 RepID=UPI0024557FC8|nr:GNAT family N-acetyltransferase [Nocardia neocaledoniensis]
MDPTPQPALPPGVGPPERIVLGGMVIRRWRPDDLAAKFAALNASFDHLHRWMPWAAEPPELDTLRGRHDLLADHWPTPDGGFTYGIFDDTGAVLGAVGLHDRVGPATLEIGYWCHVDHLGRGIVTRAAGALTTVGGALPGITRLEIRCDAANLRSAAVPRRLGYRLESIGPRARHAPGESGRGMCWVKDTPGTGTAWR